MDTQTVQSYQRKVRSKPQPKQVDLIPAATMIVVSAVMLSIVYWKISLVLALAGVSIYVVTILPKETVEAPEPEVVKPKRSYNKRVKVNHYQHGKVSL